MKKTKSIKLSATYHIKPKQLRDALVMTGREYRETSEYKEEARKQWEKFIKNWESGPQFKQFQEMAAVINERLNQINSSGLPKILKEIGERYAYILENYKLFPKNEFPSIDPQIIERAPLVPAFNRPPLMTPELINEIAEKSAEKIFERIKGKETITLPNKKRVISLDTPPGTKWENIRIQIINESNIVILIGNSKHEANYKKMGFEDSRTGHPNKQWMLLWLLAINNGSLSWEDYRNNNRISNLLLKDINKFKKTKQLLAETLKNYFKIDEDPFYSYKKEGAYRIRINLTGELPR